MRFLCFSLPLSPLLHLCLRLLLCLRHLLRFCLECCRHLEPFPACCVSRVAIRQSPMDSSSASPDTLSPSFFSPPLSFFSLPSLSTCFPLFSCSTLSCHSAQIFGSALFRFANAAAAQLSAPTPSTPAPCPALALVQ